MFFKCKHPADALLIRKQETVEPIDKDFDRVTYHFRCIRCDKEINKSYARMIGGLEGFLSRGD